MSNSTEDGPVSVAFLKVALLDCIFNVASEDSTKDSNRRRLYAFWRTFAPDESDGRVAS
jgi:ribosomal RNA-processing protein 1